MPDITVTRVAVVQAEPVWNNLEGCVKKTISLIREAASNGAQFVTFSEVWIPGYPNWIWNQGYLAAIGVYETFQKNSLEVDGPEMGRIRTACRDNRIACMLGFSERHFSSLYMSSCYISENGEVLCHRRKIKPTGMERLVFGDGSGGDLLNVVDTKFGRIGSLQCWEHLQPLLKFHTFAQHEQIHCAMWPAVFPNVAPSPWTISEAASMISTQNYAMEGGCFTLLSNQIVTAAGNKTIGLGGEADEGVLAESWTHLPGGGCSAIYGPDGAVIAGPLAPDVEGVLYANLDLGLIGKAKFIMDSVGHYSRPDLLRVVANYDVGVVKDGIDKRVVGAQSKSYKDYPALGARSASTAVSLASVTSCSSSCDVRSLDD